MAFIRSPAQKNWPSALLWLSGSPLREFVLAALILSGGLVVLTTLLPGADFPSTAGALLVFAVAVGVAGLGLYRRYPYGHLGLCNVITLTRLTLASAIVSPLLAGAEVSWGVFLVAFCALSLDGFDGWVARRQGYVSEFGARFDMEVDSFLALILALKASLASGAGAVAIVLGLPRYLFVFAAWQWPWMRRELPERFGRKVVCVLQLGALIALQAPIMPDWLAVLLVVVASIALLWSFAVDLIWLWRQPA